MKMPRALLSGHHKFRFIHRYKQFETALIPLIHLYPKKLSLHRVEFTCYVPFE
jgi:hypothetical protein